MRYTTRVGAGRALRCGLLFTWLALSACGQDASGDEPGKKPDDPDEQENDNGKPSEQGASPKTENGMPIVEAPPMHAAAHDALSRAPMDATPSPDGATIYYTALTDDADGNAVPALFAVAADGGDIETLSVGGPLTAPVGISVSLDGDRLFVADSAWSAGSGVGAIATVSTGGGDVTALAGTEGTLPRGVVIAEVEGTEWLYFTGLDPESGKSGLFRIAPEGGEREVVASGKPFADPAGVAVADDGTAYVVDGLASADVAGQGSLLRVVDGETERLIDVLRVGFPAGISLTKDAKTVLVSGLDPSSGHDRVFVVDAESKKVSVIKEPFDGFRQAAGLHRAHDKDVFAWADSEAKRHGTVYVLAL